MLGTGELSSSPVLGPWPTSGGGATAALDLAGRVFVGLAIFVAADLDYQSALVFYNALLSGVAAGRGLDKRRGEHRHRQYDPLRAGGVREGSGWTARR